MRSRNEHDEVGGENGEQIDDAEKMRAYCMRTGATNNLMRYSAVNRSVKHHSMNASSLP